MVYRCPRIFKGGRLVDYNKIKLIKDKEKLNYAIDILEDAAEILYQHCKGTRRSPELILVNTISVLHNEVKIMEEQIKEEE